jgi:hypothetical protein
MTDPPTSGSIYAFREDRLGARLISILSAIRIARRLGKPFKVNWFHATDVGSVFNDPHELFAPGFIRQNWFSGDWPAVMSGADYIANHLPMNVQRLNGMMESGRNFIESSCLAIPVFDDEDQSQALAEAAAIWAGIWPRPASRRWIELKLLGAASNLPLTSPKARGLQIERHIQSGRKITAQGGYGPKTSHRGDPVSSETYIEREEVLTPTLPKADS